MSQNPLLADPQALALESVTSKDTQVVLVAKTIKSVAPCPKCHQPSSRVHSRYQRTVADLPCFGVSVQLQLLTRRFFCVNQTRVRRIFCELYFAYVSCLQAVEVAFHRFEVVAFLIRVILFGRSDRCLSPSRYAVLSREVYTYSWLFFRNLILVNLNSP